VSLDRVGRFLLSEHGIDIPKMTLWRGIKRWGFSHGEGRRRNSLKEQDRVILARRNYLRAKRSNRNPDGTLKRPEIYLDETYINRNHSNRFTWYLDEDGPWVNKPSGVGQRLILVHAITENGWVDGAELVFEAKKRTGDYHGQMNWENFSKWFLFQLIPNIEPGSMIILDNARYHNVLVEDSAPNSGNKKEQLRSWLSHNDKLAKEHGISILRTPPYHPELQPIETCWAVVKNYMADNCDFSMSGLRKRLPKAFTKVTSSTVREIIAKVVEQEDKYWREDEKLDQEYTKDSDEEYVGSKLFEDDGLMHYLGEG
jgi:transposase